jgi:hypothetical protein
MAMTAAERAQRIEQYTRGPARLKAAWAVVPEEVRQWRPAPGKWSAHEVVCHCADSETNAVIRLRFLLAEKEPTVLGYDQEEWARRFDYHAEPVAPAMAVVEAVRGRTATLLGTLGEADWARMGRHTESGPYGVEDWLRIYSDHLEGHSRQIERNMEAWRAAGR